MSAPEPDEQAEQAEYEPPAAQDVSSDEAPSVTAAGNTAKPGAGA